jgi:hypothetical protein
MRRHVVPAFLDFDYRANALREEINDAWEETVKETHRANREQLIAGLREQYAAQNIERTIADFVEVGPLVSSVILPGAYGCMRARGTNTQSCHP